MSVHRYNVQQIEEVFVCDVCHADEVVCVSGGNGRWRHVCPECNAEIDLPEQYPRALFVKTEIEE